MSELFFKVKKLYEQTGGPLKEAITRLTWPYGKKGVAGHFHYNPRAVAAEINGYFLEDKRINGVLYKKGSLVPSFAFLQDDGSTSSGNWLYCNSVTKKGNMAMRRRKTDPTGLGLYPEWAWSWPVNRRIIYNGASVDPSGKPWDPKRAVIK